jgi:hypothetical protein
MGAGLCGGRLLITGGAVGGLLLRLSFACGNERGLLRAVLLPPARVVSGSP